MKRFLILLIGILTATTHLSAANIDDDKTNQKSSGGPDLRFEWGFTAAAYHNTINIDKAPSGVTVKSPLSVGAGLHTALKIGRFFAIQPEVNYQNQSLKIGVQGAKRDFKVKGHSVDIPVLFSLRFANIVRINAGPVFTVMNNYFYDNAKEERVIFGGVRPTFGYSAGIAVVLLRRYMIDARYMGYFNPSLNNFEGTEFNTQLTSISLKIGFLF